jgi:hypothetical protein
MEAKPTKANSPKPKRRWFQFSLRSLFVFFLICAIPCAWLGRCVERQRRQQRAADAVTRLNGSAYFSDVCYEDGLPHMSPQENKTPGWLTSLSRSAGLDRTYKIVHVETAI